MAAAAKRKDNARASLAVIATISATWNSRLRRRRKSRRRWGCAMADAVEVTAAEVLSPMMVLSCCVRVVLRLFPCTGGRALATQQVAASPASITGPALSWFLALVRPSFLWKRGNPCMWRVLLVWMPH
jgi:hypothetical protein